MKKFSVALFFCVIAVDTRSQDAIDQTHIENYVSIRQTMESVLAPATNIIWGIYAPEATEDWEQIRSAAVATIVGGQFSALGGTGDLDTDSVNNPAYQAFNDQMIAAALKILDAADSRDLDAFQKAADDLYPPCENCHLIFNPGVRGN